MANRNSKRLLTFFGADVAATDVNGAFVNRIRFAIGGERFRSPALNRFQGQQLTPAYIPINEYHLATAFLTRRGAAPLAARTMGLIFVDVARVMNTTVQRLLDDLSTEQISLLENEAYTYMNILRQNTSQLTATNNVSNAQSYRARYLLP